MKYGFESLTLQPIRENNFTQPGTVWFSSGIKNTRTKCCPDGAVNAGIFRQKLMSGAVGVKDSGGQQRSKAPDKGRFPSRDSASDA